MLVIILRLFLVDMQQKLTVHSNSNQVGLETMNVVQNLKHCSTTAYNY